MTGLGGLRHHRIALFIIVLSLTGVGQSVAQSLRPQGTVMEVKGSQVILERDTSVAVSEGGEVQVFTAMQVGETEQKVVVAVLEVQSVVGSVIVAQIQDRVGRLELQSGQSVYFPGTSTDTGPGDEPRPPQDERQDEQGRQSGTLRVRSSPSEARIQVRPAGGGEGRVLGQTPLQTSLSPGEYQVQASKQGYRKKSRRVRVEAGTTNTIALLLEPSKGTLTVQPTPESATVYVDGSEVGTGRVKTQVAAGQHRVEARADGYATETKTLSIESGQRRTVSLALSRRQGTLQVQSDPTGAVVFVNGVSVGRTPLQSRWPAGQYTVRLKRTGYEAVERAVTISAGEQRFLDVELTRSSTSTQATTQGPNSASTGRQTSDADVRFGLRGGVGFMRIGGKSAFGRLPPSAVSQSRRIGFSAAGFVLIKHKGLFASQLGLSFTQKGEKIKFSTIRGTVKSTSILNYVELITVEKINPISNWSIYSGLSFGLNITSNVNVSINGTSNTKNSRNANNIDISSIFGTDIKISDRVIIDARYVWSLMDVTKRQLGVDPYHRNKGIMISIGLVF